MMDVFFDNIVGFQWDDGNIDKNFIAHGVENWECEQVFFNEPLLVLDDPRHSTAEKRWAVLGRTDGGRLLTVIFTVREQYDPRHLRQGHAPEREGVL